jgi:para-aminobenzoate synthetase/4-amino-4-deoxychorismate lyase
VLGRRAGAPRIVPRMLDARFDDLTGTSPSFRLVGPVGVLEATRPDEVLGVLRAADAAAARGLWAAGFVAYEAAPGLDPSLEVRPRGAGDPFAGLPLAWFAMFERAEETTLPEPQGDPEPQPEGTWQPSVGRAAYDRAIIRIREHIAAGDTYQVNHTVRLRSKLDGDERGLYRDLCYAQRGSYAAYLNLGRYRILSASPELFFRVEGDLVTTRPMKGTAARGRWLGEDLEIGARLRGSVKDRAENAMIVDLLRNDLGRVAVPGTVTWTDVFDLERYETVWQLTSTVAARRLPGAGLSELFEALFPCGSVTGAPKVETMRIIASLEDSPRGVYCGAIGYVAPTDSGHPAARFSVPIRTVTVDSETGTAEYGVGGGITWDSRADTEYDEVVAKARVLVARRPRFELAETLRHDPGAGLRHLDRHLMRLHDSAAYFGFDMDEEAVVRAVEHEAERWTDRPARIRVSVDRRGRITIGGVAMPRYPGVVRVAIDLDDPVEPSDPLLFHKTTRRRVYEEARARHPDVDDVLLTNVRGEVTESTIANVAVRFGDAWFTPPRESGLLAGVGREVALDEGWLAERSITLDELKNAEEIALVSDARGRRAAHLVDDRRGDT